MITKQRKSMLKSQRQNCLVVGDAMVGKTTLIKMMLGLPLSERYESTVFLDYYTGQVFVPESSESLMVAFTDFSVETDVTQLPTESDNQPIVICYSITDRESFDNVRTFWLPIIDIYHPRNPVIIVATNVDSRDNTNIEHVTVNEGQFLANQFGVESVLEFSKFHSTSVQTLLREIASFRTNKGNKEK